jgi:RHS repeat-associated protein
MSSIHEDSQSHDGLDAIRERGGAGDAFYLRTLAIDEALARVDGTGTTTYLADLLGSTLALVDASGAPVTTYPYAPFGETAGAGTASPNPFRLTGREEDGTGLYYYRARYYDPGRGRFLGEDPIGYLPGCTGSSHLRPRLPPPDAASQRAPSGHLRLRCVPPLRALSSAFRPPVRADRVRGGAVCVWGGFRPAAGAPGARWGGDHSGLSVIDAAGNLA